MPKGIQGGPVSMNKVTIQKVSDDIADCLRDHGVSSEGNKFLKAGKILKDAGILEHLIMMYDNQQHQDGLLDLIEKSVSIGRIIKGELGTSTLPAAVAKEPEPEPEDNDPPPMFGA